MTDFSPMSALAGGALIGAAAVLLMAATGRIMGIAGIVGGLLGKGARGAGWRWAFLAGMAVAAVAARLSGHLSNQGDGLALTPLAAAGFLVGLGTRMGNGCTSGHGICGLARLSPRSLVAVLTFIAVAGLVVFLRRRLLGA